MLLHSFPGRRHTHWIAPKAPAIEERSGVSQKPRCPFFINLKTPWRRHRKIHPLLSLSCPSGGHSQFSPWSAPPCPKKYDFSIDKNITFRYGRPRIEGRVWWKTPFQALYLRFSGSLREQDENISFFPLLGTMEIRQVMPPIPRPEKNSMYEDFAGRYICSALCKPKISLGTVKDNAETLSPPYKAFLRVSIKPLTLQRPKFSSIFPASIQKRKQKASLTLLPIRHFYILHWIHSRKKGENERLFSE